MKIRYYSKIDSWRWIGFILAMISAFLLSSGRIDTQWWGWAVACLSCSIWIRAGIIDKDLPRTCMELMYLLLAIRGVWNWFNL